MHVFSPSLTNELVFSNSRFVNNDGYADGNAVTRQTAGVNLQGVFKNGYCPKSALIGFQQPLATRNDWPYG